MSYGYAVSRYELIMVKSVNEIEWEDWIPKEKAVLCFVRQDDMVLLIRKKTGLGAGKINGPGGRINPGESAYEAAIRETQEETGIRPANIAQIGELFFAFCDGYSLHCTVFLGWDYDGSLIETPEARPFWCSVDEIPFEQMWADDSLWFPYLLRESCFRGYFVFDGDAMLSHKLQACTSQVRTE